MPIEYPSIQLTDFRVEKRIRLGGAKTLALRFNVFNLFNIGHGHCSNRCVRADLRYRDRHYEGPAGRVQRRVSVLGDRAS